MKKEQQKIAVRKEVMEFYLRQHREKMPVYVQAYIDSLLGYIELLEKELSKKGKI